MAETDISPNKKAIHHAKHGKHHEKHAPDSSAGSPQYTILEPYR